MAKYEITDEDARLLRLIRDWIGKVSVRGDAEMRNSLDGGLNIFVRPSPRRAIDTGSNQIWVSLTQVGGSDGTQTTAPTWTYDATNISTGVSEGSAMTPLHNRLKGATGTDGKAHYGAIVTDSSGTKRLIWTDETTDRNSCS